MVSRAVIEQAKGILMERFGCRVDDAFARLIRESQETNTKLRDVAKGIVLSVTDGSLPDENG